MRSRRSSTVASSALTLVASLVVACQSSTGPGGVAAPNAQAQAAPPAATAAPGRTALPDPGPAVQWSPPMPETWNLKNGMRVLFRPDGSVPLLSLRLIVPRGASVDPKGRAGLTQLMADLLDEGAGARDALALSDAFAQLATDYAASTSQDAVTLSLDMIAENLGPSVALLADIARRPRLASPDFARIKRQALSQVLAGEADPHSGQRVAMYRTLFGEGYAGMVPQGTRRTLEPITLDEIKRHYARVMVPAGAELVVTGGVDRTRLSEVLEQAFGDWSGQSAASTRPVEANAAPPGIVFVDYPGAPQSVLAVVRRAPGAAAEDFFPAAVFSRGFAEAFTSRVNLNLREDKGYTYGAFGAFVRYRQAGLFGIFADVKTETTRASVDEIFKELDGVRTSRPPTAEEREHSVSGLLLGFPSEFETIAGTASRLSGVVINQRPLDWFEKWPGHVAAVQQEDLARVAQTYCDHTTFSVVIAGDRAKVAPTLEGLGLPIAFVDPTGQPVR